MALSTELSTLDTIIALTEFPCGENPEAQFKAHLRILSPTDYDDIIEERNITGRCGYALCSKPRRKFPGGKWALVNMGRPEFDIAPTAELKKWCSTICAKRALYIRVQLAETSAYERQTNSRIKIDLYGEAKDPMADAMASLEIESSRNTQARKVALASERPAIKVAPGLTAPLVVRETSAPAPPEEWSDDDEDEAIDEALQQRLRALKM